MDGRSATAETLRVVGAREHNLRNVELTLPKGRFICFTGVSGSGKSSLAFDTLYAEGQRRYIESLSSYARQFVGQLPRPDVDQIQGLAPSISIQQKTSGLSPRSTVGTITQIHDYLRVLYARAGTQHCTRCGQPVAAQTREQMMTRILALGEGVPVMLLAPRVRGQKGEHRDLFDDLLRRGFVRARVDGQIVDLSSPPRLDRYRRHDIDVVIDRLVVRADARSRLAEALELALSVGEGSCLVARADAGSGAAPGAAPAATAETEFLVASGNACPGCGLSFPAPDPQMFSFNSPQGMCSACDGLGEKFDFDPRLMVPDPDRTLLDPCIAPLRHPPGRWARHIYEGVARHLGIDLHTPWRRLPARARQALLYGTGAAHITFEWRGRFGTWKHGGTFAGIIAELQERYRKATSPVVRAWYEQFMRHTTCPACQGARLNPQALAVRLTGRLDGQERRLNIAELCALSIADAARFMSDLELTGTGRQIAQEPLKEIRARLQFLIDVGVEYLTLDRAAPTLSGGESQRIRLASQIGCGLVGVLYVLDEPSIGLHPRDNQRLLDSLRRLCRQGNTVIVVEHDRDTMEAADLIVDFGPGPGVRGGRVVARGTLEEVSAAADSLTGAYLSGRRQIEVPAARRPVLPPPTGASRGGGSPRAARAPRTRAASGRK